MDDDTHGFGDKGLQVLNCQEINWDPSKYVPCHECEDVVWPPQRGSHASTLKHFETVIGRKLEKKHQGIRLLMLFQNPRIGETGGDKPEEFPPSDPFKCPHWRIAYEHRYFCLGTLAWRELELNCKTGSRRPCWPTDETAHFYLRKYLHISPDRECWSYDAVIAYFLWLLRPGSAYITNVAKCGFKNNSVDTYNLCAEKHLKREIELIDPNLVMCFARDASNKVKTLKTLHKCCVSSGEPFFTMYLPGSRPAPSNWDFGGDFSEQIKKHRGWLKKKSYDVDQLIDNWQQHVKKAYEST